MNNPKDNIGSETPDPKRIKMVSNVIRRLDARARLLQLSNDILEGLDAEINLPPSAPDFVAEQELAVNCNEDKPNATVNFSCSTDGFDCVKLLGKFDCLETFNSCGKADFSCGKTAATPFDCGKDVFDCHDFVCGDSGAGVGAFDCTAIDFQCTGPDFECHDDFDCSGEHVFMCWEDHDCIDSFDCKNKGEDTCAPPGSPNVCVGNYHRPDQGGDDTSPGDFACGIKEPGQPNDNSYFDCLKEFSCSAKDEFDCAESTTFFCGAGGDFECADTSDFECDQGFGCKEGNFECAGDGAGKSGEFDCDLNFVCFKDFDCELSFECSSGGNKFICSPSSGFDCVTDQFTCTGGTTGTGIRSMLAYAVAPVK